MFVKPVKGRSVPDPARGGSVLPEKGRNVEPSAYWYRRLSDGDVTAIKPSDKRGIK